MKRVSGMTAREQTKLLTRTLLEYHNKIPSRQPWPEWVAVPEIEARGCSGRLDVLAVRRSYRKPEVRGCEIKVTRSDYNRDVDTGKYRRYLPICNTLYFCVPAGLVKKAEVPDDAGLMCWSGSKWTVVKRAPVWHPGDSFSVETMLGVAMKAIDIRDREMRQEDWDRAEILRLARDPGFLPGSEFTDDQLATWAARRAGIVLSQRLAMTPEAESLAKSIVKEMPQLPHISKIVYGGISPDVEDWGDEGAKRLANVIGNLRMLDRMLGEIKRLKHIGGYLTDLATRSDWELSGERADVTLHGSGDTDVPRAR